MNTKALATTAALLLASALSCGAAALDGKTPPAVQLGIDAGEAACLMNSTGVSPATIRTVLDSLTKKLAAERGIELNRQTLDQFNTGYARTLTSLCPEP